MRCFAWSIEIKIPNEIGVGQPNLLMASDVTQGKQQSKRTMVRNVRYSGEIQAGYDDLSHVLYADVIMGTIASQITSLTVVYPTVYSDADQRKDQSSASLAFVWGIHRDRWIPRTKGQLRGKCFHLMTSSCIIRFGMAWFIICTTNNYVVHLSMGIMKGTYLSNARRNNE